MTIPVDVVRNKGEVKT